MPNNEKFKIWLDADLLIEEKGLCDALKIPDDPHSFVRTFGLDGEFETDSLSWVMRQSLAGCSFDQTEPLFIGEVNGLPFYCNVSPLACSIIFGLHRTCALLLEFRADHLFTVKGPSGVTIDLVSMARGWSPETVNPGCCLPSLLAHIEKTSLELIPATHSTSQIGYKQKTNSP